jgi:penicillin-binding protein 1A
VLKWLLLSTLVLALAGAASLYGLYLHHRGHLPPLTGLEQFHSHVPQTVRMYARDGELIDEVFTEHRTVLPFERIPEKVRQAAMAAEDHRFYGHAGLDWLGIARAMLRNLMAGHVTSGGSTITQQLAKTFFLTPERTFGRKWRELLLAQEIEARFSKDEILAFYLNQICFGEGTYGVEEAARRYFGRSASQVTPAQAALLAGMIKSPARFNPFDHPEAALARRGEILAAMRRLGWLTEVEAREAQAEPLVPATNAAPDLGLAPHFVFEVRHALREALKGQDPIKLGVSVYTTLDARAQRTVNSLLPEVVRALDAAQGALHSQPEPPVIKTPHAHAARVLELDLARPALVLEVDGKRVEAGAPELARYQAALDVAPAGTTLMPGEWITVTELTDRSQDPRVTRWVPELGPQLAFVLMDPASGAVRATVGADDFGLHPFDHAIRSRRPVGSTIKPFLAAIGLARGDFEAGTSFENKALSFRGANGKAWRPRNYEGGYDGQWYDVSGALTESINTIAVQMLQRIGAKAAVAALTAAGFSSPIPADLSLALGSTEETLARLTGHYAAFVNEDGRTREPYLIERVVAGDGRVLYVHQPEARPLCSGPIARTIKAILKRVVAEGTGRKAAIPGHAVGGKTGTTNRARNVWFVGFCDRLLAGIWMGHDDNRPMKGATGGQLAAPAWRTFMDPLCR